MKNRRQAASKQVLSNSPASIRDRQNPGQPSLTSEQKAEIIIAAVGGQVLEKFRRQRRGEEVVEDRESG